MGFADLREFITALEKAGELCRVSKQVSPQYELAAVTQRTLAEQGPVLLFENVEGSDIPLLTNPFTSRRRVAFSLGCEERDLLQHWVRCLDNQIPPVIVPTGPCKDVHVAEPDLTRFPVPITWHEGDGGPFITFAQFITKDPDTGARNVGIYRLEVKDPRRIGASIAMTHHGAINHRKWELLGRDCDFALAIGTEPASYLATQATYGHGEDEYALAGALRGAPLELVRCETVDIEVPAHAEIVIEGRILANVREEEGPFGEWTGYMSGRAPRPVAEVSYMTHRADPIYNVTYEGYGIYGPTTIMQGVAREPEWFRAIRAQTCPMIKDLHLTIGGCAGFIAIASIGNAPAGLGKNVLMDMLRETGVKIAIVVDDDIDIRNMDMVQWAMAMRMQPAEDVFVIPRAANNRLDPSQPEFPSGLGSKIGIDATWSTKNLAPQTLAGVPADVTESVGKAWDTYGIPTSRG
ncbi:MAG TPA: UbiD family decarboxylase [Thermohalobaculum sp.]|nr:UbiD family decarboxylase [Thermohalobaculum sp.]